MSSVNIDTKGNLVGDGAVLLSWGCTQGRVDEGPSDGVSGGSEAPDFTKHP